MTRNSSLSALACAVAPTAMTAEGLSAQEAPPRCFHNARSIPTNLGATLTDEDLAFVREQLGRENRGAWLTLGAVPGSVSSAQIFDGFDYSESGTWTALGDSLIISFTTMFGSQRLTVADIDGSLRRRGWARSDVPPGVNEDASPDEWVVDLAEVACNGLP